MSVFLNGLSVKGVRVGQGPSVTGISSNSGSPGDSITVTGTNLQDVISVTFPVDIPATITFNDSTTLTFTIPPGGGGGLVHIITPNGEFDVTVTVTPAPPSVTYSYYGYFTVQNITPEPGPYPVFAIYDNDNYPQDAVAIISLQSDDPTNAVGRLTVDGWQGDYSLGGGTGSSVPISPMAVNTTRTYEIAGGSTISGSRFYFPMVDGDSAFIVARTGDGGSGIYTAGTMTIVIGPSATQGERYLISWPQENPNPPPDAFISMQRLTDIGPRP